MSYESLLTEASQPVASISPVHRVRQRFISTEGFPAPKRKGLLSARAISPSAIIICEHDHAIGSTKMQCHLSKYSRDGG